MSELRPDIERYVAGYADGDRDAALAAFLRFRDALTHGEVRAAERDAEGVWRANGWVKQGILLGFRLGAMASLPAAGPMTFIDKDTFPPRAFTVADGVRVVPGGSSVREGAYVARGVVCMPPMYVNVGAYVDEGTMIDSHALVGSCAQIGKRVHLSAAAQIGGVLEPAGALPVVIEDDVFVGGNCGVYEGTIVRRGAILAPGVLLTGGTPVYDLVHDRVLRRADGGSLEVPENAVVVPGTRPAKATGPNTAGVGLYAPVIVKYRDEGTNAAVQLEEALR
ncbi:MAG: 2,3,4,5-tetrahydropyridine-2,6-dicarboxylate N-succinyltransferase [Lacipirellulaceae bacterium]